ncbi:AAA-ATPase-like domain-containing protein [Neocallimastix lanati (nom. inval.)]|nr:AAA-ATPase-like domain-containing protein [Neocallimastix sp. JGI-2020a]
MLVSYYSKGIDQKEIFDKLKVAQGKSSDEEFNKIEREEYFKFQSMYHTLYFDFSYGVADFDSLDEYLNSINQNLKEDIEKFYPDSKILKNYNNRIYNNLRNLYIEKDGKFIIIIDEWDYIISSEKFSADDQKRYITFLQYLIKDQPYIAFTYMTGIFPIAKQLPQSSLNCLKEYSMLNDQVYYQYFGFIEQEVRDPCENNKTISYEKLEDWYNGYKGPNDEKIFNTWSVCQTLSENKISNYWTNTGRFDELITIINFNLPGIKDEILELINGEKHHQVV